MITIYNKHVNVVVNIVTEVTIGFEGDYNDNHIDCELTFKVKKIQDTREVLKECNKKLEIILKEFYDS